MKLTSLLSRHKQDCSSPRTDQGRGRRPDQGQSLVETAIILPVFILMLLGVFEVGWALRGYLVLANVNREATRFASRGVYLDMKQKTDPTKVGYEHVISHTFQALAGQLDLDFLSARERSSIAITYYNIEPQAFACPGDPDCSDYDCSLFIEEDSAAYNAGKSMTLVEYPKLSPPAPLASDPNLPEWYRNPVNSVENTKAITGYYWYEGPQDNMTGLSRIDPAKKVEELRAENNQVNCGLLKKKLPPTSNNVIIVENIYYQHQLTGFSFVTAFVADPIPLYTHTAMRLSTNVRSTDDEEANSCQLMPIIIPLSEVSGRWQGDEVIVPFENNPAVIPGAFGWLEWDAEGNNGTPKLIANLNDPNRAGETFKDASDPSDTAIDIQLDWVTGNPGLSPASGVLAELDNYVSNGTKLYFPVFNDLCSGAGCSNFFTGSGNNGRYRIMTFAVMTIEEYYFQGNHPDPCAEGVAKGPKKCMVFQFDHFDPGACQPGNGR